MHFVLGFVPDCNKEELRRYSAKFVGVEGPWHSDAISIDMAKQFLMKRISSFRAEELAEELVGPDIAFVIRSEQHVRFFEHLCEMGSAMEHLSVPPDAGNSVSMGEIDILESIISNLVRRVMY